MKESQKDVEGEERESSLPVYRKKFWSFGFLNRPSPTSYLGFTKRWTIRVKIQIESRQKYDWKFGFVFRCFSLY